MSLIVRGVDFCLAQTPITFYQTVGYGLKLSIHAKNINKEHCQFILHHAKSKSNSHLSVTYLSSIRIIGFFCVRYSYYNPVLTTMFKVEK